LFPLLYRFIDDPAPWMAYAQFAVIAFFMALTYGQVTRRRMGFMVMFGFMALIFFVDLFGYLPFLLLLFFRSRRSRRTDPGVLAAD
jgi:hypothetical protein